MRKIKIFIQRSFFHSFQDLNTLSTILKSSLKDRHIIHPTFIQNKALPLLLEGKDAIISSETGSGKTLTYLIPILNKLLLKNEQKQTFHNKHETKEESIYKNLSPKSLIIVPTRELCQQIIVVLAQLKTEKMNFSAGIFPPPVGVPSHLSSKKDIAVTTLGGLSEFLRLKKPRLSQRFEEFLSNTETIVVDECDFIINEEFGEILLRQKCLRQPVEPPNIAESVNSKLPAGDSNDLIDRICNDGNTGVKKEVQREKGKYTRALNHLQMLKRQILFVCATLTPKRHPKSRTPSAFLEKYYPKAVSISSENLHKVPEGLQEFFIAVEGSKEAEICDRKKGILVEMIQTQLRELNAKLTEGHHLPIKETDQENIQGSQVTWLIFANSANQVNELYGHIESLARNEGINNLTDMRSQLIVEKVHADLPRLEKGQIVAQYISDHSSKKGTQHQPSFGLNESFSIVKNRCALRILISTDVFGRGIDFANVSKVIHYNFPTTPVSYIHRVGRTARAGKLGESIAFVTIHDERLATLLDMASKGITNAKIDSYKIPVQDFLRKHEKRKEPFGDVMEDGEEQTEHVTFSNQKMAMKDSSFHDTNVGTRHDNIDRPQYEFQQRYPLFQLKKKIPLTGLLQPRGKLKKSIKLKGNR